MRPDENKPEVHWTRKLFVQNAHLYLPFLEQAKERAPQEVEALSDLFARFGVSSRGRVLDLACGAGRHSVLLAKRGYRVTGMDISPLFIEKAREYAEREGVEAGFILGDALEADRVLAGVPPFDAFINMFTSHSYYGREGDVRMFGGLRKLAAPGAPLVVLTANRDYIVKNFAEEGLESAGSIRIFQKRKLDLETSNMMNTWHFFEGDSENLDLRLKVDITHRVYSLHELKAMLEESGWEYLRGLGRSEDPEFRLDALSIDSPIIWVAARA